MYLEHRTCEEYLNGVELFISAAKKDMLSHQKSAMLCPCRDYANDKKYSNQLHVHVHLILCEFVKTTHVGTSMERKRIMLKR